MFQQNIIRCQYFTHVMKQPADTQFFQSLSLQTWTGRHFFTSASVAAKTVKTSLRPAVGVSGVGACGARGQQYPLRL